MKIKRAGIITKIVIIAVIIYAAISLASINNQITAARVNHAELESRVKETAQTNAKLEYDIEHATDDETIESLARSKLGLVKPGEIIFYDQNN